MESEAQRAVLALLQLPRIGRKTAKKILDAVDTLPDSESSLQEALAEASHQRIRFPEFSAEKLRDAFGVADSVIEACQRKSIRVHLVNQGQKELWLKRVDAIPDAPVILFSKGDVEELAKPCVAIIGTRNPTSWGAAAAEKVARRCVGEGFTVVSGLAVGCDVAAHQGAIKSAGKTAAVLAHGLDMIHPHVHTRLAEKISSGNGCLISEYAPGVPPQRGSFVERDRLQSALSSAVIVVETGIKGGTNHTVSFAREQDRLIGCLVHPEKNRSLDSTQGNISIVSEGATPISTKEGLLKFLENSLIRCGENEEDEKAKKSLSGHAETRQNSLF